MKSLESERRIVGPEHAQNLVAKVLCDLNVVMVTGFVFCLSDSLDYG